MSVMKVKVVKLGSGWALKDAADDTYFYNMEEQVRTWAREGGAIRFLERHAERNRYMAFIVTRSSGKVQTIGEVPDESAGPHDWEKRNLVTLQDRKGMYDLWYCRACNREEKRYGLGGRPSDGYCSANLL